MLVVLVQSVAVIQSSLVLLAWVAVAAVGLPFPRLLVALVVVVVLRITQGQRQYPAKETQERHQQPMMPDQVAVALARPE